MTRTFVSDPYEVMPVFYAVSEVERAMDQQGSFWFCPTSMRFFSTRLGQDVYGGRYFITSEQFDYNSPRLYTIREVVLEDGKLFINTVGEFQGYRTRAQAVSAVKKLVK